MPVYEFLCRDCTTRYDDLVGVDHDLDDESCPECRSGDVVRLYSPFSMKVGASSGAVSVDGSCLPGPAGRGGGGGCCGGGCGGCG